MPAVAHSQFLNLPAEIRREIYNIFFQPLIQHAAHRAQSVCEDAAQALDSSILTTSLIHLHNPSGKSPHHDGVVVKEYLQLLLVCRLVHDEALPLCYNNVAFYVRKPLDFANNFLRVVGWYKLSQIRHLEMRLEATPIGVDGWSFSAPKPSQWNHHQVRMLFENYPELECLDTMVITIEKFADRRLARHANLLLRHVSLVTPLPLAQSYVVTSAWSQNRDTDAMRSGLSRWKFGMGLQCYKRAFTIRDDYQIAEKDMRFLSTVDGRHSCQINMKRIFTFTLWKTRDV